MCVSVSSACLVIPWTITSVFIASFHFHVYIYRYIYVLVVRSARSFFVFSFSPCLASVSYTINTHSRNLQYASLIYEKNCYRKRRVTIENGDRYSHRLHSPYTVTYDVLRTPCAATVNDRLSQLSYMMVVKCCKCPCTATVNDYHKRSPFFTVVYGRGCFT